MLAPGFEPKWIGEMVEIDEQDPDIFYCLDSQNTIVQVGPGWDEFAQQNGAPELKSQGIIGRQVVDFFFDEATRRLYLNLFERVKKIRREISFEYRCDSPLLRRFMRLTVSPGLSGGVTVLSQTLSRQVRNEECFQWERVPSAAQRKARLRNMILMAACGVCSRVQVRTGGWLEIEHALKTMDLTVEPWFPLLTPTTCPECARAIETAQA